MSHYTFQNNARSTLSAGISAADASITLNKAAAPYRDPAVPSGGSFGLLTITDDAINPTKIEIVSYSGVTDNGPTVTLTGVTRGIDGTTGQSFSAGASCYQAFVAMLAGRVQDPASVHITGGTIANVSFTNATGVAPSSHVGAGGSAHALVVAGGASGFMSGADKTKLDGLTPGDSLATVSAGATFTAVKNTRYLISSATTNATMPASPTVGDTVYFIATASNVVLNTLRNAQNIMGLAEDMTTDMTNFSFGLVFAGASTGWRII
jgi:hypothetical protein